MSSAADHGHDEDKVVDDGYGDGTKEDTTTTRRMNDTTMPPPPTRPSPLPQKSRIATTTTSHNNNNHDDDDDDNNNNNNNNNNPIPRRRDQVALRKGFGLSDWNKLLRSSTDLAQRRGRPLQRYRWNEIKRHRAPYDGWVVLRGKVYNIASYLPYHPGGESILRKVLGKDITALYDKYHRWVNEEG